MSCPRCGGSSNVPVAPGYVECRGVVEVDRPAPVPGGRYLYEEPCRTRYATANALGPVQHFCSCGMAAISRCTRCASYACYDCAGTFNTPVGAVTLCGPCSREEEARRKAKGLEPTITELRRIAALPAGGLAELLDLFHQRGGIKEGVTHQFGQLTNREVAEFLQHVFGPRPRWLVPYPEESPHVGVDGRDLFLEADGTMRRIHDGGIRAGTDGTSSAYMHYPAVNEVVGAPERLFRKQLWHDSDFPANIYNPHLHYWPIDPLVAQALEGPIYAEFEWRQQRKLQDFRRARGWIAAVSFLAMAVAVVLGVLWASHGTTGAALLAFVVAVAALWPASAVFRSEPERLSYDEVLPWSPGG